MGNVVSWAEPGNTNFKPPNPAKNEIKWQYEGEVLLVQAVNFPSGLGHMGGSQISESEATQSIVCSTTRDNEVEA
jgi:hypothetical protein